MPQNKPPHKLRFAVLASDVVLFTIKDEKLQVLLIDVHTPPHFVEMKGLPGGLIHPTETADEAAQRHMKDKGGIRRAHLEQLYTFSDVDRDPRGRVVSVAYLGLIPEQTAGRAADNTTWMPARSLPRLAYDHNEIVRTALQRLRGKVEYTNIVAHLLPKEFTLTELQEAYEIILNKTLDKRNFRKKILSLNLIEPTGSEKRSGAHRPAALYRFTSRKPQVVEVL